MDEGVIVYDNLRKINLKEAPLKARIETFGPTYALAKFYSNPGYLSDGKDGAIYINIEGDGLLMNGIFSNTIQGDSHHIISFGHQEWYLLLQSMLLFSATMLEYKGDEISKKLSKDIIEYLVGNYNYTTSIEMETPTKKLYKKIEYE